MKKILSIGLVVVIVLSLGAMSFANSSDTFERGFGNGTQNEDFERGYGRSLSNEEFDTMRESRRENLNRNTNLSFNFEENGAADLASITDLTEEEIIESNLTLHEIAENENVLDEFHTLIVEKKIVSLNTLVSNGTISQEKADFMIDRMNNADGSQLQERMGQNSSRGNGRGFNRK
ncbi:hypothetical protein QUF55_04585 [Clostridiaceae bacterium HSG29]|nr:hypothetical protein [Clostridiaceae bacterium HSG29]